MKRNIISRLNDVQSRSDARGKKLLKEQVRVYDVCFAEFLKPELNGQKEVQSILLREAFRYFNEHDIVIQKDSPTVVLDVSCGPGDYSTLWTTQASQFFPQGMAFHCADFKGGKCQNGLSYPTATVNAIKAAALRGDVKLSGEPMGVEADLFSGKEAIISAGKLARIVHWSHSGYYVYSALGGRNNNPESIARGVRTAMDKIWDSFDQMGLMFSFHETGDVSDGIPSEKLPIAERYASLLSDVPQRISQSVSEKGGYSSIIHFVTPLGFPEMTDAQWGMLSDPAQWEYLDADQSRVLRLLAFMVHDFLENQSNLEKLHQDGRLASLVHDYKAVVRKNGGYINVKCAFQLVCKSEKIGRALAAIAAALSGNISRYLDEMNKKISKPFDCNGS